MIAWRILPLNGKFEMDIKDDPDGSKIICPKCGFKQDHAQECSRCGVVFKKITKNKTEKEITEKKAASTESDPIMAKVKAEAMFYNMESRKASVSFSQVFKWTRISILFLILLVISVYSVVTSAHVTSWDEPLHVVIYPLNGDGSQQVADYIDSLDEDVFLPIEEFIRDEAEGYELGLEDPILIHMGPEIGSLPPDPPEAQNPFYIMFWSLRLRYWAFKNDTYDGQKDIRLFVLYRKSETYTESLERSLGLKKGLIGLVRSPAGAGAEPYTNFIIAHEMLHTVGAYDKYDPKTLFPRFPEGYAEPDLKPLYPQELAEIMGGRIPIQRGESAQVQSLDQVVIGEITAQEIKWVSREESQNKE
jgi:hypothetical protein